MWHGVEFCGKHVEGCGIFPHPSTKKQRDTPAGVPRYGSIESDVGRVVITPPYPLHSM